MRVKKEKVYFARDLRRNQTNSELIMWKILRNRKFTGLKFRRQYLIDGYIIDFYCSKLKLAIEIDGLIHLKKIKEDKLRQKDLEDKGIKFIRFTNKDIEFDLDNVLGKLHNFIQQINFPSP